MIDVVYGFFEVVQTEHTHTRAHSRIPRVT